MAFFGEAEVKHGYAVFMQECRRGGAAALVSAMRAPGSDDLPGSLCHLNQYLIVFRPDWLLGRAHGFRIRIAPRKYIGDTKAAETQHPRATFASLYGGVISQLVRH